MHNSTSTQEWEYPRCNLIYMRELGEGQFGKVLLMKAKVCYACLQCRNGANIISACSLQGIAGFTDTIPVAVKTLSSTDPEVVTKFMEEAELMKKFSHPNIVSLLGKQPAITHDFVTDMVSGSFHFMYVAKAICQAWN